MKRSIFIEKYKISSSPIFSPESNVVSIRELIEETSDFLSNNFEGLFRIEVQPTTSGLVRIPLDYIIGFFKLLVTDIYARKLINVNYSCHNYDFVIKISVDGGMPVTKDEMRELIRTAMDAGFDTEETEDGLLLTKAILSRRDIAVFARAIVRVSIIKKKLLSIFFGK